ncbi:MAG: sugar transferase [Alphaproteobacteria bacterium]|jgi:lipopolysaccharide/colanic/teichoic acid biosynthesis glycosyltransferase|nr:sugar transferase [Alphaproteobacteria bacterium]
MTVHFESIDQSGEVDVATPTFSEPVRTGWYTGIGKRVFDLALILIALPIVVPVMAVIALALIADGQKPFFFQKRVGRDGREFTILKFRTMVLDADERLQQYLDGNEAALCEWRDHQKLKEDPRVTRLGRALRKTSLDELPQLWNVIKGEMSLVGPRPMMPHQRRLYPGSAYYAMLPGITGPWQVSARNESEFRARAQFDTRYGQSVSLLTDIGLLFRTITVVFRGTGC